MEYPGFNFDITHRCSSTKARCGIIQTPHGPVETPNFIFCATKAAMKAVTMKQVRDAGAGIVLSNTYHLHLNPGPDFVQKRGGLQKMTGWNGPMLTDSGGFQIFSLGHGGVAAEIKGRRSGKIPTTLQKITEEGARFRSYVDGRMHTLTPEISIQTQRALGADLILTLDECTPFHSDKSYTESSMLRSHRWEMRSLKEFQRTHDGSQALYGIVQGGVYPDLREQSGRFVAEQPFFGQAVGGSLGGDKSQMQDVVAIATEYLHPSRPTHLLGIGGISDLWNGVQYGIDTFDCVHPTRLARHAGALVYPSMGEGRDHLNLLNARFKDDDSPIMEDCSCECCSQYSRAYLHYLFKAKEPVGGTLLSIHNIAFMSKLAAAIRKAIKEDKLEEERKRWLQA